MGKSLVRLKSATYIIPCWKRKKISLQISFRTLQKHVVCGWQSFFIHVHRTGTPLSPGIGSAVSAAAERMTSDSSPGDVNSGLLLSFVLEVMILKKR